MSGPRIIFAIPGDLTSLTGGYGYDRRVMAAMPARGLEILHCQLPAAFPWPSDADIDAAVAAITSVAQPGDVILADGLAFGAFPPRALSAIANPIIALCHHPLCLEAGLTPAQSDRLRQSETLALAHAAHVIVTSPSTGDLVTKDLAIPSDKITVALPGTDRAERALGSQRDSGSVQILAIGSIIPRKAFDVLVEALSGLGDLDWHLKIAGSPHRDPKCAAALIEQIVSSKLSKRVTLLGEISADDLDQVYSASDFLVSSSLYEGYGMALAEAMARGLPIITTTGGAAADTVPDAAALKVLPGDAWQLRDALRTLIADVTLRKRLSDAAWQAGQALPDWTATASIIADTARHIAASHKRSSI